MHSFFPFGFSPLQAHFCEAISFFFLHISQQTQMTSFDCTTSADSHTVHRMKKKKKMKQQKSDGTVWPRWWHTRMFFFFSLSEKNNILLLIILHRFVRSTFVTSAAHVKATYYHRICARSPGRCSRGRRGLKGWRNCWFKLQQEKSIWNQKVAALKKKQAPPSLPSYRSAGAARGTFTGR